MTPQTISDPSIITSLPRWDSRCVQTVAEPGDQAANDELWEVVRGRLKDGADDHNARANKDGSSPSERIAKEDARHRSCEA